MEKVLKCQEIILSKFRIDRPFLPIDPTSPKVVKVRVNSEIETEQLFCTPPLLPPPKSCHPTRPFFADEDEEQPRCLQLTNQHKGAIRAIRKVSFFRPRATKKSDVVNHVQLGFYRTRLEPLATGIHRFSFAANEREKSVAKFAESLSLLREIGTVIEFSA